MEPLALSTEDDEDLIAGENIRRPPSTLSGCCDQRRSWKQTALLVSGALIVVVVIAVCAFTGGVFAGRRHSSTCPTPSPSPSPSPSSSTSPSASPSPPPSPTQKGFEWGANVNVGGNSVPVVSWLDENLQAKNIEDNLRNLTTHPHVAGTPEVSNIAEIIYNRWRGFGFDKLEMVNYTVLLSYPNRSDPNSLQLLNSSGSVLHTVNTIMEPPLIPSEMDSTVIPPFNAYSAAGTVQGPLVYVNYGTVDDFIYLTSNLSLNLNGSVCISRYGNIYRGNKARLGQQYGCAGLIIYSDPADYAPSGTPVFPFGPSLPPGGIQRGSLLIPPGDPLTPGIPAIPGVYRTDYQSVLEKHWAPSIPVQPISYGDAIHLLEQLDDIMAPPSWQGELNMTYLTRQSNNNSNSVYLKVTNYQEERTIFNVIATIYGGVEPDRTVVLSNHHDAWTFGAVDPNSGTAIMMEIARGLSELRKLGWRPGRTIVLGSWDAEEQGLLGSSEWVEDHRKLLGASAVACLNVDVGVSGETTFQTAATPMLNEPIYQATKLVSKTDWKMMSSQVKCPNAGYDTVYDEWLQRHPFDYNGTTKPLIYHLGSGSDHVMFIEDQGISSTEFRYYEETDRLNNYAVYHSVHDNFFWMSNFGDTSSFSHHLAVGLVWSKLTVLLSTSPLLCYDPRDYAIALTRIYSTLETEYGDVLQQQNISLDYLKEAVNDFTTGALYLWADIQQAKKLNLSENENVVRIINGKLMNIERAFIHDEGLPGRPFYKHVVFAPSSVNSYGGSVFPGISDTVFNALNYGGSWDDVHRQIDIVRVHTRYATQIMMEPSISYISSTNNVEC